MKGDDAREPCVVCGEFVEPGEGAQAIGPFPSLHSRCAKGTMATLEVAPRARHPVCRWCDEPVLSGEQDSHFPNDPLHLECAARSVLGPLAHLHRRCSCWGGDAGEGDPPGLTKRQAARLVLEEARRQYRENWHMLEAQEDGEPS